MTSVLKQLGNSAIVPVLRSPDADVAIATARGLAQGGLNVIEVTYSTPDLGRVISELARDKDLIVGAGTVLTERQAHDAADAGAHFLVSPVWLPWLVALAHLRGIAAIPGAATPTEIWRAHDEGADAVKVFPIMRLGGARYIRDLLAPLPDLKLMATGGVDDRAAADLLDAGCFAVGVGRIGSGPLEALPDQARAFRASVTDKRDS